MEKNKFWIYLGLGVVVAFSLKWVSGGDSATIGKRWSLNANLGEDIQYKRATRTNNRVSEVTESRRVIPLPAIKSGTSTAAPAVAKKTEVAKADNKAKKNEKKKKRRKKRLKAIPAPGFPEDPVSDESDDSEAIAFNGGGAGTTLTPINQAGAGGAASPNEKTKNDWEKSLLTTPNARETSRFIGAYQTRQISKEVFYGVVGQMLNDGRTQMRQLGVNALGGTPSIESYQMLVETSANEQGVVKSQAERYLDTYSQVQNLEILYLALTMPDMGSDVKIQALNDLRDVATQAINRKPSSNVEGDLAETEAAPQPSSDDQRMFRWFAEFNKVLSAMATSEADEAVKSLAQSVQGPVVAAMNYFDPSKIAQR